MKTTRLSILMQYFHIKVKDLAEYLHIDPSLASRWKNGDRILLQDSPHFGNTIEYIFYRDERTSYANIKVFLKEYYPDNEFSDYEELKDFLGKWLAGHFIMSSHNHKNIYEENEFKTFSVYRGDKNKKEALLNLLDTALLLTVSKKIYIMIGSDINEHLENLNFYNAWIERLFKLLNNGHQIYFIYNYAQNRGYANNLRNFFYLSSSEQYQCYYVPVTGKFLISYGLFIVEDVCALTDFISSSDDKNSPLFLFTNQCIVEQFTRQFKALLESCKLLTNKSTIKRSDELTNFIKNRISADGNIYIYDEMPLSFPISPDILRHILTNSSYQNDIISTIIANYTDVLFAPATASTQNECRYIFNTEAFVNNVKSKSHVLLPSILSESNIMISCDYYHFFIKAMLERLSTIPTNIKIALVDNEIVTENIGIMVMSKENLFTYVSPYLDSMAHLDSILFTHPSVVIDSYTYYDHLWESLPDESKDLLAVKAQLKRLLDRL